MTNENDSESLAPPMNTEPAILDVIPQRAARASGIQAPSAAPRVKAGGIRTPAVQASAFVQPAPQGAVADAVAGSAGYGAEPHVGEPSVLIAGPGVAMAQPPPGFNAEPSTALAAPAAVPSNTLALRAAGPTPPRDNGQAFARAAGGRILALRSATPIVIQQIIVGTREVRVDGQDPITALVAAGADHVPANALVTVIAENASDTSAVFQIELDFDGSAPVATPSPGAAPGTTSGIVTASQGRVLHAGDGTMVRSTGSRIVTSAGRVGSTGSSVRNLVAPHNTMAGAPTGTTESADRIIDVAGVPIEAGKAQVLLPRGHAAMYRQHLETGLALPMGVRRPVAYQLQAALDRTERIEPSLTSGLGELVILAPRHILLPLFYSLNQDAGAPSDDLRVPMLEAIMDAERRDEAASLPPPVVIPNTPPTAPTLPALPAASESEVAP